MIKSEESDHTIMWEMCFSDIIEMGKKRFLKQQYQKASNVADWPWRSVVWEKEQNRKKLLLLDQDETRHFRQFGFSIQSLKEMAVKTFDDFSSHDILQNTNLIFWWEIFWKVWCFIQKLVNNYLPIALFLSVSRDFLPTYLYFDRSLLEMSMTTYRLYRNIVKRDVVKRTSNINFFSDRVCFIISRTCLPIW